MSTIKKVSIIGHIGKDRDEEFSYDADRVGDGDFNKIKDPKQRQTEIMGYDVDNKGPKFGTRHVQILLMFFCMTIGFTMRTNLSVAIVAMTNQTSSNPDIPVYDWTNTSVILSSFFWGYVTLQVLAGYVGKTYGPKYFLFGAFLINSIIFMVIPTAAEKSGSTGVIICRIFQGAAQGFMFPSAHTVLGRWAPAEERSTMGIIVYSGVSCGSILSSIITGFLSSTWWGWPSSFYLFGGLGIAWSVAFLIFGQNSPATHPRITKEERVYIQASLGQLEDTTVIPTPWKSIITCIHLWAIVIANTGAAWGYSMMMTQIPTYLSKVMNFNVKTNGLVTAIPYIVAAIFGFIFAPIADFLIKNQYLSRKAARKLFTLFGFIGQATFLLLLAYVAKTQFLSVLFLAIGNAAYSATLVGYSVNHVDLSPRFSGIMQGISNASSQFLAIFSPLLVQFVVTDQTSVSQWRIIFITSAVMYVISCVFYTLFGSATRQSWDGPKTASEDKLAKVKKQSVVSISGEMI
ncbi:hypothetical protein GWI33_007403 [Rhynchophorus ferrugineus]|uniref:Putative inorganic phosphate cotransporter n=1 Tax=Rhynchophorus ferrugineus TaxID=354439 RepID=A0A834MC69_RHYFE|nr:hypothetical protein GWI33_007403 [Rhynchophorus ferrugineus]